MIIEDFETYAGLVRRYSDLSVYLMNEDGDLHSEAVDLPGPKAYTETDIPVETDN